MYRILLSVFTTLAILPCSQAQDPFFEEIEPMVLAWNKAIDEHNGEELVRLYAAEVEVYGSKMSREKAINGKKSYFAKHPDFHQKVEEVYEFVVPDDEETVRAWFNKTTTERGKKKEYNAFLDFRKKENGTWEIIRESDWTTERVLASKVDPVRFSGPRYCFAAGGTVYNRVAIPAPRDEFFDIRHKNGALSGEGLSYSSAMRTTYELKITGKVVQDGTIHLRIAHYSPFDDIEDGKPYVSESDWCFDGKSLRWTSGDPPSFLRMKLKECEGD